MRIRISNAAICVLLLAVISFAVMLPSSAYAASVEIEQANLPKVMKAAESGDAEAQDISKPRKLAGD